MPYVTSIERLARKEGREEGREVGLQEGREVARDEACSALRQEILEKHQARWGPPSAQQIAELDAVRDLKQLVGMLGSLVTASTQEEWLREQP